MQFGFSTNAFREYQLEDAIGAIADAGYDGVELLLDEPHLYPPDCTDEGASASRTPSRRMESPSATPTRSC